MVSSFSMIRKNSCYEAKIWHETHMFLMSIGEISTQTGVLNAHVVKCNTSGLVMYRGIQLNVMPV